MMPGNILGFDANNTIGFQTRTDDIHIGLDESQVNPDGVEIVDIADLF